MRQPADENVLAERSERTKRKERTKFQCKFSDMTEEIPADIFQTHSTRYLFTGLFVYRKSQPLLPKPERSQIVGIWPSTVQLHSPI